MRGNQFRAGRPRVWSEAPGGTLEDIGPDGRLVIRKSVITNAAGEEIEPGEEFHVFLDHFFDDLKRRVPLE